MSEICGHLLANCNFSAFSFADVFKTTTQLIVLNAWRSCLQRFQIGILPKLFCSRFPHGVEWLRCPWIQRRRGLKRWKEGRKLQFFDTELQIFIKNETQSPIFFSIRNLQPRIMYSWAKVFKQEEFFSIDDNLKSE